ncbi:MAG: alpha/beta hydrolase [Desulfobacterales bacterium]|nr:alpha/beta hydrolase [Desulfobacterales bacterium]
MAELSILDNVCCEELIYRDDTDPLLRLTLYWHPSAKSPTPAVLWFFRGGWFVGDRGCCEPAMGLLEHGFAVVCPDYRLSHQAKFPAQIEDCKAAVRWVRGMSDHFNIDGQRIGVWGDSAGGHLAAMIGTASDIREWDRTGPFTELPSTVKAVCNWCGPTDFYRMNDRPGAYDHDDPDSFESRLMGAPIREVPETVRMANPVTHINGYCPSFLIMHGKDDDAVLPEQSQLLHERLLASGARSNLIILPGYGHGFGKKTPAEVLHPVVDFFKAELNPESPQPQMPKGNEKK